MSLQINSVSLVTGAGSGIAKVSALTYSVEGARDVVIADLNYKAALQTAQESELIATNPTYRPHAVAVDVTDTESVNYMVTAGVLSPWITGEIRDVGRGVILNLGSGNSYIATPDTVPYTTKHAVMSLTKSAALDLAPHGIRVNAVRPRWVNRLNTPMVTDAVDGNPGLPDI